MSNKVLFFLFLACFTSCNSGHSVGRHKEIKNIVSQSDRQYLENLASKAFASNLQTVNDSLIKLEKDFKQALITQLKKPTSINQQFYWLKKYNVQIQSILNHQIRLFSWFSAYTGSMWQVQNIFQYQDEKHKLFSFDFNNLYPQKDDLAYPTPFFNKIIPLNTSTQKMYILIGNGQMSGTEPYSVCHILVFKDEKFSINEPLFKIGKKHETQLFVSAMLKSDQDKAQLLNQLEIKYDSIKKIISYPEITGGARGFKLTGKRNKLIFKNGLFQHE